MRRAIPKGRIDALDAEQGLTPAEVDTRRQQFGPNAIVEVPSGAFRELARETLRDPMIWFLLATSGVYLALGSPVESAVLLAAVLPLVAMDGYLHRRTRASLAGLSSRLASQARAVRDGALRELPATELVVGDLVEVRAGEGVPADGVVLAAERAQVDESTLTGEAHPVPKLAQRPPLPESLEHEHWGFAGTRVLTGALRMRVVFAGAETLYGEIVRSARSGAHERTPLQQAVSRLVAALVVAAGALCAILAAVRLAQGRGLLDAALSAATLAVAALPEEFPVALTFFLGVGVYRLARRQALVRRSVSVENVGRVSAICSDKTGTLTEGALRVEALQPAHGFDERALLTLAALASRTESGDPLDLALLEAAEHRAIALTRAEVVATFPFTEARRRESVVLRTPDGLRCATKGSPEVVLARCALPADEQRRWLAATERLAGQGDKVIACAVRPLDAFDGSEPNADFELAGLLGCGDPVRAGAAESVAACREAGIRVLMVTGDHPETARAVASRVGLGTPAPRVISGEEMAARVGRGDDLRDVDVVARAVPSQKLTLVKALQAAGHIVAVTGDGVNDVPALQAADVGIAMGERGTRSAREVASVVLLDDNFRTIVRAIAEGRQLFRNLQLSFFYLLAFHFPLVMAATLVPMAGYPLLFLPVHVVWLEAIIHPTAIVVFQELPDSGRLVPRPASRRLQVFRRAEWASLALVWALITTGLLLVFGRALGSATEVLHARAVAMATLVCFSAALTVVLGRLRTRAGWVVPALSVLGSALLIQVPALAALVHVSPLHLDDWALVLAVALTSALPAELANLRRRSAGEGRSDAGLRGATRAPGSPVRSAPGEL